MNIKKTLRASLEIQFLRLIAGFLSFPQTQELSQKRRKY